MLFLEPIAERLRARGWPLLYTSRRQAQTQELAAHRGMDVAVIGTGDARSTFGKAVGVLGRALRLGAWVTCLGRPALLVSCSRSASLVALTLRFPGVALLDYEHAELRVLTAGNAAIWMPDLLRGASLPSATRRVARFYAGLKENLYLDDWVLDRAAERNRLGVTEGECLVVSRPPADTAHYASGHGVRLWLELMKRLGDRPRTRILVASRTRAQREQLAAALGPSSGVEFLQGVVSGPTLIAAADLVVGGGGTMNREAAVLGVPAWSVFTGPPAHIDECLAQEGRLHWVRTDAELVGALARPMPGRNARRGPFPDGLLAILADIEDRLPQLKGG